MTKLIPSSHLFLLTATAALAFATAASAQMMPGGPGPDMTIDAKTKAETVHLLAKGLREAYVFPDTGQKAGAALEDHLKGGEYDKINSAMDFAQLLTTQLAEITHDKHLHVMYSSRVTPQPPQKGQQPHPDPQMIERMREQARRKNFGFEKVQILPGNIGYLKFNVFGPAEDGAGQAAAGAMAFLANTDALIIDLRDNHGGNADIIQLLATYFYQANHPPVHLNDIAMREEGKSDYDVHQVWTLPYVPGELYGDKKEVYILTSHITFSAAEEFTYDLQVLKRATIVGEVTGGGANPGGPYRLGDHFLAFMPRGHSVNPVTKTNWEGKGIEPDIKCPAHDALVAAQQAALERLLSAAKDPQDVNQLKQALAKVAAEQSEKQPAAPAAAASSAAPSAASQNATGNWTGQITDPASNPHALSFDLKVEGNRITGSIIGGPPNGAEQTITNGKIEGSQISFDVSAPGPDGGVITLTYFGKIAGNQIQGSVSSTMGRIPFRVTKQ